MALPDDIPTAPDVPLDTFSLRIAIARIARGWNITDASRRCGINPESWRLWEKNGRSPQHYEEVCKKIAEGTGWSRTWLIAGGPLRSRCFWQPGISPERRHPLSAVPPMLGQLELGLGESASLVAC